MTEVAGRKAHTEIGWHAPAIGTWLHAGLRMTWLGGLLVVLLGGSGSALGQTTFREIREDEKGPIVEDRIARTRVPSILRIGRINSPEEEELFTNFFRHRIASMTWEENRDQLPRLRFEMKRQFLNFAGSAPTPELHERLNDLLLTKCGEFALSDEFHPVVRANCMLLIGYLDSKEPNVQGQGGVPLAKAFPVLLDALADEKLHDAVRAATFVGLKSHVDGDLPADRRTALAQALVKIVKTAEPPAGKELDGQLWLRYRGAELLGRMAAKWPEANNQQVADALYSLVADEQAPLTFRARAAWALGYVDGPNLQRASTPVGEMAPATARVAAEICKQPGVTVADLSYFMSCINLGLKGSQTTRGLLAAADNETKPMVQELVKRTGEMLNILAGRQTDSFKMDEIRSQGVSLEQYLSEIRAADGGAASDVSVAAGERSSASQ